ncbi:hypothetical protein FISHEDRAFT_70810 [Fistulina hepatica ATCC 64428]|uniref:Uncharacterized protein n=1 Tax=Fistulina hepatica ATCC 64428 TaxID=1128425 RepID=A0A0D7AKV6_9AGAR|nr:hypothetical protein FISHEDRAFT_70810 [Fistulina hepatica ATCC 64428]
MFLSISASFTELPTASRYPYTSPITHESPECWPSVLSISRGRTRKSRDIDARPPLLPAARPRVRSYISTVTPQLVFLYSPTHLSFKHSVSAHPASAHSILPCAARQLHAFTISGITSFQHNAQANSVTFEQGNAAAMVRAPASGPLQFFTVWLTTFAAVAPNEGC